MNEELLEALEKTYAAVTAKMLGQKLIIFVSNDWLPYKNRILNQIALTDMKYRGISIYSFQSLPKENNKIIIMREQDAIQLLPQ